MNTQTALRQVQHLLAARLPSGYELGLMFLDAEESRSKSAPLPAAVGVRVLRIEIRDSDRADAPALYTYDSEDPMSLALLCACERLVLELIGTFPQSRVTQYQRLVLDLFPHSPGPWGRHPEEP